MTTTEYITESEYEKRFAHWSKGRKPASDGVEFRLGMAIRSASKSLARIYMGDDKRAVVRYMRDMRKHAAWSELRCEFAKRFEFAPTGPDKNAIPFCGDWKQKKCKICGGGHPVGCCAQDGNGG